MATRRVSRKFPVRNYTNYDADSNAVEIAAHHSEAKVKASPDDWGWNTVTVEMTRADMIDMLRDAVSYAVYVRNLPRNFTSVNNMLDAQLTRYRAMLEFVEDSRNPPTPAPEPTYSLNV